VSQPRFKLWNFSVQVTTWAQTVKFDQNILNQYIYKYFNINANLSPPSCKVHEKNTIVFMFLNEELNFMMRLIKCHCRGICNLSRYQMAVSRMLLKNTIWNQSLTLVIKQHSQYWDYTALDKRMVDECWVVGGLRIGILYPKHPCHMTLPGTEPMISG
jgi:hypothetical protein